MKKVKTVNAYIDENEEYLDRKIITVYNDDKNIVYRGKAEYAPLSLYMECKSVDTRTVDTVDGDTVEEVIINGAVEHKKEETTEEATTRCETMGFTEMRRNFKNKDGYKRVTMQETPFNIKIKESLCYPDSYKDGRFVEYVQITYTVDKDTANKKIAELKKIGFECV